MFNLGEFVIDKVTDVCVIDIKTKEEFPISMETKTNIEQITVDRDFKMEDYFAVCDICGKKYDNYMRTFFVQYSNDSTDRKCCCGDCLSKESRKKPHRYTNHIPMYYDGGKLITRLFDSKEEMIDWLIKNVKREDEELCCARDGEIIAVNKNEKFWWVDGFSTLDIGDLPNFEDTVIKYHGSM